MPIQSIRHRGLRQLFERDDARRVPAAAADKLRCCWRFIRTLFRRKKLDLVISDIGLVPGWRLHPLKGGLAGCWSLTVTRNWRLTFWFEDGDAHDLDLLDYH